jgi:hypothetical protein
MVDAPKPSHCAWQGTVWPPTTDVQVRCSALETICFTSIFQSFHSHYIPEAAGDTEVHFFAYSTPFWYKIMVDVTLSIKQKLQPAVQIHSKTCIFFNAALTYASSSIHNVSEVDLYRKNANILRSQVIRSQELWPLHSLCGLMVRVPGYRSRGTGSIPGAARFSEK